MYECLSLLTKTQNVYSTIRCNTLHTSTLFLNSWRQAGNAMKKVMGATRKKKLYYEDSPKMPPPEIFNKGALEGKKSIDSRRSVVLNKLFMRHVTDQLATGSCSTKILGLGVEINRVQVTPDYKIMKVYWLAKGTSSDEIVEEILERNSGLLRHELSQLRLMGVVPRIKFVKDKQYARVVELDNRLRIADFGEDHIPTDPSEKLRTEFEILSPLNESVKERLKVLDQLETEMEEELPLPPMPQNVLGLNHADILDRIRKCKQKSKALHRINLGEDEGDKKWATFKVAQPINENPVELGSYNTQRTAFREFLLKRQLLQKKAKQLNKNYIPDVEYIKEELVKRQMEELSKFDFTEIFDEDFVEEEEDVK